MSAKILQFPKRAPFAVTISREGEAWLVTCRNHSWLCGCRDAARTTAADLAGGFDVPIVERVA
jgi:hypothetical protein